MSNAHKLLLLFGGAPTLAYLVSDEFTSDEAAPLTSPRTAEPGPGTMTIVDTASRLSIGGDQLVQSGNHVAAGDPGIWAEGITRAAGLAVIGKLTAGSNSLSMSFGFDSNQAGGQTVAIYFLGGGLIRVLDTSGANNAGAYTATTYDLAVVLRTTGAFYFIKGGAYTLWTLLFVGVNQNFATAFGAWQAEAAVANGGSLLDYLRLRQLPAPFDTDYGLATINDTTLTTGDTFVGNADGSHDFFFTLPSSPTGGDKIELRYRRQDASNYWSAYSQRNVGNTAWDFLLDEVVAGTPTNKTTVTGVGTPDAIRVVSSGSVHTVWTKATTTWTQRGTAVTDATHAAQTGLEIVAVAGTTLTRVNDWPVTSAAYTAELDRA
jgi:hypothetical protein